MTTKSKSHFVLPPPPPPPPTRRRRPPRNYHWSQKGTKQSRREARARHASGASATSVPPTATSRFDDRPTCQIKECKRRVGKRNLGGFFTYCYHHRHLNVSPTVRASRRNITVKGPVPSPLDRSQSSSRRHHGPRQGRTRTCFVCATPN